MTSQRPLHGHLLIATSVIICVTFIIGFVIGKNHSDSPLLIPRGGSVANNQSDGRVDFAIFWNEWDLLQKKYVDSSELDTQDLVYGAVNGMFQATGDQYTTFLNPEESQALAEDLEGSFQGIGAEIGLKDHVLTIIAPLDDSPAQKSGLEAGDRIVDIDGESAIDLTVFDAVKRIRGEKGTNVVLTVFREGDDDTRDITITRDDIHIDSVRFDGVDDGIAFIRVAQFGDDTFAEFQKALSEAEEQGMQGLVIDLRNNPGGLLTTAVKMVGLFTDRGSVALIEKGADQESRPHITRGSGRYKNIPLAILLNQGSASASEIFAGALQDHLPQTQIVGQKSFGKGSVQELVPMRDNTAAKITTAKWFTPLDRAIDGEGLDVMHEVEVTREDLDADRDPQEEKAREEVQVLIMKRIESVR